MTVKELIEFLQLQDQEKVVHVWNCEWDSKDSVDSIEVDKDGDIVIF